MTSTSFIRGGCRRHATIQALRVIRRQEHGPINRYAENNPRFVQDRQLCTSIRWGNLYYLSTDQIDINSICDYDKSVWRRRESLVKGNRKWERWRINNYPFNDFCHFHLRCNTKTEKIYYNTYRVCSIAIVSDGAVVFDAERWQFCSRTRMYCMLCRLASKSISARNICTSISRTLRYAGADISIRMRTRPMEIAVTFYYLSAVYNSDIAPQEYPH